MYNSMERTGLPELLAPAGSMDALIAAVNAGADAVYLGGKRFGARKYSPNFTNGEIKNAVGYAHSRGTRVYVTVNTLVHDRELPDVAGYLIDLYAMGVDAILIQDPGVSLIARDLVPDLPRHASTQCTITNREGVLHARRSGYDRVVLAREVPLDEIDRVFLLPEEKRPGIEIFIHGALCYAYSGQCLLSSVIGGRSGNRGACAQPCRREYSLVTGPADQFGRISSPRTLALHEPCLLSTRDLCLFPHLPELIKRPFAALKIEGRMRSPEYVAIVVSIYRKALNGIAEGSFTVNQKDLEDLAVAFSRGFTSGYLMGDRGSKLMGRDRPDNRGLFLGTVRSCSRQGACIETATGRLLFPGDGLVAIDPVSHKETGFLLRKPPLRAGSDILIREIRECRNGMALFLTSSVDLERRAAAIRNAAGPAGRFPIPIDITLTIEAGTSPLISGTFLTHGGDPVSISSGAGFIPGPAERKPTSDLEITRQLVKSGGTSFVVRKCTVRSERGLFLPIGQLNRFRRQFFEKAETALIAKYLPDEAKRDVAGARLTSLLPHLSGKGSRRSRVPEIAVFSNDPMVVAAACQACSSRIYFEPDPGRMDKELTDALTICRMMGIRLVWKWPRVPMPAFIKEALALLPSLADKGLGEVMTESPMYAAPIRESAPGITVTGGPDLNVVSACAVRALLPDCTGFTLSPELAGEEIADLCSRLDDTTAIGIIVQGNIPAMITEDALLDSVGQGRLQGLVRYGLADATGRIFPLHPDPSGRTHILNAVELCLIDYLPDLAMAGVDTLILDCRWRSPAYAAGAVEIYREALGDRSWIEGTGNLTTNLSALKARIRSLSQGGITAGHYLRALSTE